MGRRLTQPAGRYRWRKPPTWGTATTYDAAGNVTTDAYDAAGDVLSTQVTDAQGQVIRSQTNTYDADGNVLTSTDAAGDVTRNTYEGGRLVSTTVGYGTASAALTSYTYDVNSNVASETDPDGNVTSYTDDALGDVTSTVTPLGTTTAKYDQAGNKVWQQDADGRVTTYAYDGGRLTTETQYNADGSVADILSYTYDADGNMLTATDAAGTVTMTYDGNRLVTRTDPFGLTITYGYDDAGNVISEADSLGGLTTRTYDGGRLTSLTYQDAGGVQLTTAFTYDADGNVLTAARYAVVSGAAQLAAQTNYAYDGGEATSIVTTDPGNNVIQSDSYTYDVAARLSSQTDNGVLTAYAYDATSQLTVDGGTGYTYDANGNRTIAGYVTGTDNELLSDGTWDYTYDAEGNTVTKVNIATGETWTYGYDLNNRMVSAVDRQANGTLIQSATYAYDALGDRIQESVTANGVTTVTNSAFDAAGNVWADLNGSNNNALQTRRLFLQGADEVFARIGEAGGGAAGVAWYLTDHLGSVQSIVNNAGVVLDQRTYGAFGDITSETDPSFLDRYGYAGGQLDPVTGFVRFGKRLDNTAAGRFITPDPTGMSADSNYYRIDGNGPTYRTDPTGLAWGWGDYTLAAAGFVVLPLNVVNAAAAAHGESPTQGAVGFGKGLVEPFVAAGDAAQDVGHFLGVSGAPQYRSDTAKAVQRDLAGALQAGYSTPEAVGLTLVKGVSPIVYGTAAGPAASYAVNGAMTGNWNPVPTPEALGTTTTVIVVTAGVTKVVSLRGAPAGAVLAESEPNFVGPPRSLAGAAPIEPTLPTGTPADPVPTTPRPGRMHVAPIEISSGTGCDFVIPGRSVEEVFAARMMNGSKTLQVTWTESLGEGTVVNRLAQAQKLAGGPGSITQITGQASYNFQALIRSGQFNAEQAAQALGQRLGGRWRVDVAPRPNSSPPTWDVTATRLGD